MLVANVKVVVGVAGTASVRWGSVPGNSTQPTSGCGSGPQTQGWYCWESVFRKSWKMMDREERNNKWGTAVWTLWLEREGEGGAPWQNTHPLKPMEDPHWSRKKILGGRREKWPDQNFDCPFPHASSGREGEKPPECSCEAEHGKGIRYV